METTTVPEENSDDAAAASPPMPRPAVPPAEKTAVDTTPVERSVERTGRHAARSTAGSDLPPRSGDVADAPADKEAASEDAAGEQAGKAGRSRPAGSGKPSGEASADGETADGEGSEGGETDAFAKFSPAAEEPRPRWRVIAQRTGRVLTHEWTVAALVSLVLAAVMTWPTLKYPAYTIPQDIWDPTLVAWIISWSGHAMTTDVTQLLHANAFHPEAYSYVFTDTLLGYFPAGMIGSGFTAALVRYNIIYVLLHALAFFGAYALVRQLGAGKTGAAVAGAAFAFAPWRLAQAGHMHVISTGGIALALAMLARGHGFSLRHGYQPEKAKPGWAFAGWFVAAWQISLGFGIGLPFGYVMAGITLVALTFLLVRRFRHGPFAFGWKLLAANVSGGLIFAGVTIGLALAYLQVAALHPNAVRSEAEVSLYSPPLLGFFVSPAESVIWGEAHTAARETLPWHPEMTMLPGFVLYGLACAGLILSIWSVRQRLFLLGGVILSIFLAMGTATFDGGRPGYMTLYDILPGWDALRTSGRLVIWTTLLLAILAAGAVSAFVEQVKQLPSVQVTGRPHPLARALLLIPVLLVLGEGLNNTPHPVVPPPPPSLALAPAPIFVLPSDQLRDEHVMLWLTKDFQPIINGGSGFTPQSTSQAREVAKSFPDEASVQLLRQMGVQSVVVLRQQVIGTPYEGALSQDGAAFGLTREDHPDAVIFRF
jgi:hypothetical protein